MKNIIILFILLFPLKLLGQTNERILLETDQLIFENNEIKLPSYFWYLLITITAILTYLAIKRTSIKNLVSLHMVTLDF